MTRSIADIGWDELAAIAGEAGENAATETQAAGISTFGVIDGIAYQVKPDGSVHDLGPIAALDDPFAVVGQAVETEGVRQRLRDASGGRPNKPVEDPEKRGAGHRHPRITV